MRLGAVAWGLGERFGIDLVGSTEGPPVYTDPERRKVFDELIAAAREGDGTVPVAECPYPAHELLTHLVLQRGLLLHGSNNASLEVLEARPAHDLGTVLEAVVTSDDAIWPMFYAVIDREPVKALFTGCVHVGRPPRLRRFYFFAVDGDPADPGCWTDGVVYAMPRAGFRREWGREWVSPGPVRPSLRVPRAIRRLPAASERARGTAGGVQPGLLAPASGQAHRHGLTPSGRTATLDVERMFVPAPDLEVPRC